MPESRLRPPELAPGGRKSRINTTQTRVSNQFQVGNRRNTKGICAGAGYFNKFLASQGIAYVPYFPLGGFSPLQSSKLNDVAELLNATPMQVALAWLLRRSSNMLLIPGTSSVQHLRENLKAATLELPDEALATLDSIGAAAA